MAHGGEIVKQFSIKEDQTGYNYEKLFGKYLNGDTTQIELEESYLREFHQFQNLICFLELAVRNCNRLRSVAVLTTLDPKNPTKQRTQLQEIAADLGKQNINFSFQFEGDLHDRRIVLNNGYTIILGRGLHFFKACDPKFSLGMCDFRYRKCKKTNISIVRTPTQQCACC